MGILGDAPLCRVVWHSESSSLHSSYGRVFGMAAFTGIVSRMCFLGTTSTRCNLVGGWMEKHFRNGVQQVIQPFAELHSNSLYLLLEQFSVHMQHNNTFTLQQIGIEVDFIPSGYTPVLQVQDKGVHKP
jgi:hypothetical protein